MRMVFAEDVNIILFVKFVIKKNITLECWKTEYVKIVIKPKEKE